MCDADFSEITIYEEYHYLMYLRSGEILRANQVWPNFKYLSGEEELKILVKEKLIINQGSG